MATLTANYDGLGIEGGFSGTYGYVTLNYSTSSNTTSVTITANSVTIHNYMSSTLRFTYRVYAAGTSIGSGSVSLGGGGTTTVSLGGSKTVTKGRTATTVAVSVGGDVSDDGEAGASANISVGAKPSYTVSYNANGGSNAPSSQTKWYGETLTLTSSKPSRSTYAFWHWNTNASNAGTTYNSGASYTNNAALSLYAIWNPIISFNANGGSGAPSAQTKTYGTNLTLSSTTPARAGYSFIGWNTNASGTGTTYAAGGTYSSNTSATLYAMWQLNSVAPTISSISVVRSDSTGAADDGGSYAMLTAEWYVDTNAEAEMSSNTGVVTGTIREYGSSTTTAITFDSGATGTSGTATALIANCSTDLQYVVEVTVTNTVMGAGASTYLSTSRTDVMTRAFFTMDFASGGRGIGVGTAAPTTGFECGMEAQFNHDVSVLGDLVAANLDLEYDEGSDVLTGAGNFTVSGVEGWLFGPFAIISIGATTSVALTAGSSYQVASIAEAYRPNHTFSYGCSFGGGSISGTSINVTPNRSISANSHTSIGFVYLRSTS